MNDSALRWVVLGLACPLLAACMGSPSQSFSIHARDYGFVRVEEASQDPPLVLFYHGKLHKKAPLTIYLDGDGNPAAPANLGGQRDPTTRERLVLELMRQETGPAVLIGRPCYYPSRDGQRCSPKWWQEGRYSEAVVVRLATAFDAIVERYQPSVVTVVGYSGGGALAVLLAARRPEISSIITIAANLDTAAWAKFHGHKPLADSLNPLDVLPLPHPVRQLHFYGGRDQQVPVASAQAAIARDPTARVEVIESFDHRCCWAKRWGELRGRN